MARTMEIYTRSLDEQIYQKGKFECWVIRNNDRHNRHNNTNIGTDNEVVDVIMNKLTDEVCNEIESNEIQMSNMNNEKENIEKNDEDVFSAQEDRPLTGIVSTDIGYLHFTKFLVISDTLRKISL